MRGFLDKIARVIGWMDALEFAIPAVFAALLLVAGPLLASFYFYRTHHYLAASLSGGIWILSAISCIRDLRRREFGPVSLTLVVVWLVTTLIVSWRLEKL
jgi:hypothetical protein